MNCVKYIKIALFLALPVFLAACQNDPLKDLTVEDSRVFITNHDKSADFGQYTTFSIVDSVVIYGNQGTGTSLSSVDIQFLNAVIQNMKELGYTYVSPKDSPDLGLNVAQVRNAFLNVVSVPISPYFGNYWGGFGPGFGFGYPVGFSYYQTQENYWYIEMLDFKNPDQSGKKINVIWSAQIRGSALFDGIDTADIVRSVFSQSAYLRRK